MALGHPGTPVTDVPVAARQRGLLAQSTPSSIRTLPGMDDRKFRSVTIRFRNSGRIVRGGLRERQGPDNGKCRQTRPL